MSRHTFDCKMECMVRVVVGYDRLNGYFLEIKWLDVQPDDGHPEILYTWENDRFSAGDDLDYYRIRLEHLGLTVPESMFTEVRKDDVLSERHMHHFSDGRVMQIKP